MAGFDVEGRIVDLKTNQMAVEDEIVLINKAGINPDLDDSLIIYNGVRCIYYQKDLSVTPHRWLSAMIQDGQLIWREIVNNAYPMPSLIRESNLPKEVPNGIKKTLEAAIDLVNKEIAQEQEAKKAASSTEGKKEIDFPAFPNIDHALDQQYLHVIREGLYQEGDSILDIPEPPERLNKEDWEAIWKVELANCLAETIEQTGEMHVVTEGLDAEQHDHILTCKLELFDKIRELLKPNSMDRVFQFRVEFPPASEYENEHERDIREAALTPTLHQVRDQIIKMIYENIVSLSQDTGIDYRDHRREIDVEHVLTLPFPDPYDQKVGYYRKKEDRKREDLLEQCALVIINAYQVRKSDRHILADMDNVPSVFFNRFKKLVDSKAPKVSAEIIMVDRIILSIKAAYSIEREAVEQQILERYEVPPPQERLTEWVDERIMELDEILTEDINQFLNDFSKTLNELDDLFPWHKALMKFIGIPYDDAPKDVTLGVLRRLYNEMNPQEWKALFTQPTTPDFLSKRTENTQQLLDYLTLLPADKGLAYVLSVDRSRVDHVEEYLKVASLLAPKDIMTYLKTPEVMSEIFNQGDALTISRLVNLKQLLPQKDFEALLINMVNVETLHPMRCFYVLYFLKDTVLMSEAISRVYKQARLAIHAIDPNRFDEELSYMAAGTNNLAKMFFIVSLMDADERKYYLSPNSAMSDGIFYEQDAEFLYESVDELKEMIRAMARYLPKKEVCEYLSNLPKRNDFDLPIYLGLLNALMDNGDGLTLSQFDCAQIINNAHIIDNPTLLPINAGLVDEYSAFFNDAHMDVIREILLSLSVSDPFIKVDKDFIETQTRYMSTIGTLRKVLNCECMTPILSWHVLADAPAFTAYLKKDFAGALELLVDLQKKPYFAHAIAVLEVTRSSQSLSQTPDEEPFKLLGAGGGYRKAVLAKIVEVISAEEERPTRSPYTRTYQPAAHETYPKGKALYDMLSPIFTEDELKAVKLDKAVLCKMAN